MHWAVWIWVVLLLMLDVVGFVEDLKERRAWPRTSLSLASGTLCPALVLHYHGLIDLPVPRLLVVLAAVGLVLEARWVIQEQRNEPDYSPRVFLIATLFLTVLYAPALILGWIGPR